ncbi:Bacteriophage HK97-gp10, putative tail-component [Paenibacillus sophorae]|uniref:Bacteriophage HK97-gp10, putative tail-component n=1 Tax=Paenibacillus sophorae TaxID=1333845 RepID=A0A1H8L839_9BACL|nr:HK97 gp10 family phage protein [Paenibacillus sophorae]QWU17392.1 HK97 gp10 family phage protein [Paenibacillus sophorae]SEO01271.1 Bacteriophage HK97-gp10, putative tail-component [Paenibacillus sophorae]
MGSRGKFFIELTGLEEIISHLDDLEKDLDRRIDAVLTKLAMKIIHDAKRLAPIDSGDLEAALIVGEVKQMLTERYIEFGTSPEVDSYAVVQHEGFRKTASGAIVQLTPGEKTRSKGQYNGYTPGKKYLENAIKMNEDLIRTELSKILEG